MLDFGMAVAFLLTVPIVEGCHCGVGNLLDNLDEGAAVLETRTGGEVRLVGDLVTTTVADLVRAVRESLWAPGQLERARLHVDEGGGYRELLWEARDPPDVPLPASYDCATLGHSFVLDRIGWESIARVE